METPAEHCISPAVTIAGPLTSINNFCVASESSSIFNTKSFKFRIISVTSSLTPSNEENS